MTDTQKNTIEHDWIKYAKEPLTFDYLPYRAYAYGSELAILRLYFKYQGNTKATCGYSNTKDCWWFTLTFQN